MKEGCLTMLLCLIIGYMTIALFPFLLYILIGYIVLWFLNKLSDE